VEGWQLAGPYILRYLLKIGRLGRMHEGAGGPAPKGASEFGEFVASLKRCPDTELGTAKAMP
jgi:hypothetical protein